MSRTYVPIALVRSVTERAQEQCLNRPGLVNLRAAVRHFGVHPPGEAGSAELF